MTNKNKKICIISFSKLAWDGKVIRQISTLLNEYEVTVVGYGKWDSPENVRYYKVNTHNYTKGKIKRILLLLLGKVSRKYYEIYYWNIKGHQEAYKILAGSRFDVYHANDLGALPLAIRLSNEFGGKVIFDAHEFSTDQVTSSLYFSLLSRGYRRYIIKKYASKADTMITVSEGLVYLYKREYNLDSQIIYNAPNYFESPFNPVKQNSIRLVHYGIAIKQRSLEELIELTSILNKNYSLHFYLLKLDEKYYQKLIKFASNVAPDRVHFHAPIDPKEITQTINAYDIGIHLLKGSNLNHLNALPNKLFEFIMAGLCVVTYPLPIMGKLITQKNIGVVSSTESIKSIVKTLNKLSVTEIELFKKNSLKLANELNAEVEGKKLIDIYRSILE